MDTSAFWKGDFGDNYTMRCRGIKPVASNVVLFEKILKGIEINSILELGSNIGLNLMALSGMYPEAEMAAVDINSGAVQELRRNMPKVEVFEQSIMDFRPDKQWDLVMTKSVLIHIPPERLDEVYTIMFNSSSEYILLAEYYSPSPVEVMYRGYSGKLFKRDFAGEMLDRFPLTLVDYGFAYHRDASPQDDLNWFLMKKNTPTRNVGVTDAEVNNGISSH